MDISGNVIRWPETGLRKTEPQGSPTQPVSKRLHRRSPFLILLAVLPSMFIRSPLASQTTPLLDWYSIYDGPAHAVDIETAAALDLAGNFYVAGRSSGEFSGQDYAILEFSPGGEQLQTIRIDGSANHWDEPVGLIGNSSGFTVTGTSYLNSSLSTMLTLRYDSSGSLQWRHRYPADSSSYSGAVAIESDQEGNIYVGGFPDFTIVKYSPEGSELWARTYRNDSSMVQSLNDVAVGPDGIVYATGIVSEECPEGLCRYDMVTMQYSADGTLKWLKRFTVSTDSDEQPVAMRLDGAGDLYVIADGYDSTGESSLLLKYTPDGELLWFRSYDGTSAVDLPAAIAIDGDQNVVIAGTTWTTEPFNFSVVKYSSSGDLLWSTEYGRSPETRDFAYGLAIDSTDNVYVTGGSRVGFLGPDTLVVVKFEPDGNIAWVASFVRPDGGTTTGKQVFVHGSDDVYVMGGCAGPTNGWDFLALKFRQIHAGIDDELQDAPLQFGLSQNYPNPFNSIANLQFRLPAGRAGISTWSDVSLVIYDLLGREVATLVDERLVPGTYNRQWDASNVASGVYMARLTADKLSSIRKLVLVR